MTGSRCLLLRTCIIRTYVIGKRKFPLFLLCLYSTSNTIYWTIVIVGNTPPAPHILHTHTTHREQYIIRIMHDNLLLALRPALIVFVCGDELDFVWLLMTLPVLLLLTRPHSHQLCIQWRHSRTDSFNNVSFWGFLASRRCFFRDWEKINTPTDMSISKFKKFSLLLFQVLFYIFQSRPECTLRCVRPSAVMACS